MRTRVRRLSLLSRFSILSLLVIAAIGVGVGAMLHQRIERRGLIDAMRAAEVLTAVGLQPHLRPELLGSPLTLEQIDGFDARLQQSSFDELGITRVKLFNADGRIVYSDERSIIGEMHPDSPGVQAALSGRTELHVKRG